MAASQRRVSRKTTSGQQARSSQSVAKGFRLGRPLEVELVRQRVGRIIAFRGYRIPAAERPDLVQEILTQLWQATRRPDFDESAGFWGFVELVSTRRCIDWLRARRPVSPLPAGMPDTRDSPLQETLTEERLQLMRQAMADLGEPCRSLIDLHVRQRQPYRDLTSVFGRSEGALRMQMLRCVKSLRALLRKLEQPGLADPLQEQPS